MNVARDPLELLTAMVDRSLVVVDGDDSFRMLDSLRAFTQDRLRQRPGEPDATRRRLASRLVAYCKSMVPYMRGPDQEAAAAAVRADGPDLRATLEWSFMLGDPSSGARLAVSLIWFWAHDGTNAEAVRWLRRALQAPDIDDRTRARLLAGIAAHATEEGDLATGRRAGEESMRLWNELGTPIHGLVAIHYLSLIDRWCGDIDKAAASADRAISLARDAENDWGLAWSLYWRGGAAVDQEDDSGTAILLDEAASLAERVGEQRVLGLVANLRSEAARRAATRTSARPGAPGRHDARRSEVERGPRFPRHGPLAAPSSRSAGRRRRSASFGTHCTSPSSSGSATRSPTPSTVSPLRSLQQAPRSPQPSCSGPWPWCAPRWARPAS